MTMSDEFKKMISTDIERIKNSNNMSDEEKLKLHRELDGRYQACIKDWYKGFWCADPDATYLSYNSLIDSSVSVQENLEMMRAKLETFQYQMNTTLQSEAQMPLVNVTTNLNVNISFEQVRSQVEDMTSLTDEQTKEVLDKISEIENAINSTGSKKSKWEKIKPVLKWLADKSFDVGMALLPLLFKLQN